ncbi:MAG: FAD-binding oxidoreductase [Pseudomonadota bacterium]
MDNALRDSFTAIVGERYALCTADDMAPYTTEMRNRYHGTAAMALRPGNVEQVSAILELATKTGTAIIPQGGNTGLVGAGVPLEGGTGEEVIVSLGRMNRILEVDADTNTMTVEAGAILENIQNAADDADRLFPLSLGSQGTCQIGGNISANAGGTGVIAYGNTRDLVMGLEVVQPNGRVWNGLSKLRKDNTGYDLKNLIIGAEGTLGIVTKAVLKLFPKPAGREVAIAGMASTDDALKLLSLAKAKAANGVTAFEFMARVAMEFTVKHTDCAREPLESAPAWYVLLEISSPRSADDARETMEAILTEAFEEGTITDAVIAESGEQQNAFWKLREDMSWAQRPEGASIKHDISVPIREVPRFIELADAEVQRIAPGSRIVNFGHLGDGNLHYNISQPVGWTAEQHYANEPAINDAVYAILGQLGGSISAEHGIGQMKRDKLAKLKDPVALEIMRSVKQALDPANIMNPGKVITV